MAFEGWQQLCMRRSTGESWTTSTSSKSGSYNSSFLFQRFDLVLLSYVLLILVYFLCCSEEILNPSVPMALRLSGILMGTYIFSFLWYLNDCWQKFKSILNWYVQVGLWLFMKEKWNSSMVCFIFFNLWSSYSPVWSTQSQSLNKFSYGVL